MTSPQQAPAAGADEPRDGPTLALREEVARLSRRFGADPEYTRGGGGNSSAKMDGVLYIKASGQSLASLTGDALMPLRMEPLLELLAGGGGEPDLPGTDEIMRVALGARVEPADDRRPSVECLFHALLPEPIVLHTHPTVVNALTCAKDGRRLAATLFGGEGLWVPYVDPGLPLARLIAAERRDHEARTGGPAPRAMLLQNHGLIVTGESADEVAVRSEHIVGAVRARLAAVGPVPVASSAPAGPSADAPLRATAALVPTISSALRTLLTADGRSKVVRFDGSPAALEIASTSEGRELVGGGPLTPDQIVYTGSWPLWLGPIESDDPGAVADTIRDRLQAHVAATGASPSVVVVAGLGLFVVADTDRFAATANEVILDAMRVAQGATRLGGVRVLAPEERRFIEEWEAEAYRRGVESAAPLRGKTT
ncbi:MAG TPA: class II aldolase/adducin family protein [Candidatus Limnocylindrales bacterium]